MKKTISLLLILCALLSLVGCKKYKPVKSSELESTTVYTISHGGKSFEVKYELYRALFLNLKSAVDGGDETVWSGEDKEQYIEKIDATILAFTADIYAALLLAESIGVNLYDKASEKKIESYIKTSIEGGTIDGETVSGVGSYEEYLRVLKSKGLNYSVQVLLYRYAMAVEAIEEHYIGTFSSDDISGSVDKGAIEYTEDDVRAFYESDGCVRVLRHFIQAGIAGEETEAYAERVRGYILDAAPDGDDAVANTIMANGNLTAWEEVKNGYVMGRYNLDRAYFGEMTDAAFALAEGEVSEVIRVADITSDGYYILYRAEKSEEHFDECYSSICYVYLKNKVGEALEDIRLSLTESISATDFFKGLDRAAISMD
ncbi:MAG: peptidyl-prolyl cis-trans isomerase [Clostridia bacterium]|nr:peptidyl-prolyl cis-trans isomerase [Clostridia bacterium]